MGGTETDRRKGEGEAGRSDLLPIQHRPLVGTRGGLYGRLRLRRRDTPTITTSNNSTGYSISTCRKRRVDMENWAHGRAGGAGVLRRSGRSSSPGGEEEDRMKGGGGGGKLAYGTTEHLGPCNCFMTAGTTNNNIIIESLHVYIYRSCRNSCTPVSLSLSPFIVLYSQPNCSKQMTFDPLRPWIRSRRRPYMPFVAAFP